MDGLFFLFTLSAVGVVIVWTVLHGAAPGLGDAAPDSTRRKRKPRRA